ncbi:hypothetical protein EYF80_025982 [Liparis tanakae]|uniref:Uncharacterized protein n=1 Tax=Liparis tanakae TaxID=230148 RepID=A0A4Z2HE09_9TELE|nr:hypothetical protein EYF80_025982 [Liparis tanakae]
MSLSTVAMLGESCSQWPPAEGSVEATKEKVLAVEQRGPHYAHRPPIQSGQSRARYLMFSLKQIASKDRISSVDKPKVIDSIPRLIRFKAGKTLAPLSRSAAASVHFEIVRPLRYSMLACHGLTPEDRRNVLGSTGRIPQSCATRTRCAQSDYISSSGLSSKGRGGKRQGGRGCFLSIKLDKMHHRHYSLSLSQTVIPTKLHLTRHQPGSGLMHNPPGLQCRGFPPDSHWHTNTPRQIGKELVLAQPCRIHA